MLIGREEERKFLNDRYHSKKEGVSSFLSATTKVWLSRYSARQDLAEYPCFFATGFQNIRANVKICIDNICN